MPCSVAHCILVNQKQEVTDGNTVEGLPLAKRQDNEDERRCILCNTLSTSVMVCQVPSLTYGSAQLASFQLLKVPSREIFFSLIFFVLVVYISEIRKKGTCCITPKLRVLEPLKWACGIIEPSKCDPRSFGVFGVLETLVLMPKYP